MRIKQLWRAKLCSAVSLMSLFCGLQGTASAQEAQAKASHVIIASYEPTYFNIYSPQTALDMISQVPGFSISGADEKRGLGEGGANILVNGRRLTGKTDPQSQLSRINARNVTLIEIVDGVSLSISGLSGQVANIHTDVKGRTGNWRWSPEFKKGIEPDWYKGEVSFGGKWADIDYLLKFKSNSSRAPNSGPERLLTSSGEIFETREEVAKEYYDRPSVNLDLKYEPRPEHTLNLSAAYEDLEFEGDFISEQRALQPRGNTQSAILDIIGRQWSTNIGVDYEFPLSIKNLGAGRLKLIGFYDYENQNPVRQFDVVNDTGLVRSTKFPQNSKKSELIFRGEYSLPVSTNQAWQASLEGAFNDLDVTNQFLASGPNGVFVGGPINGFVVGEDRAEVSLSHNRKLSGVLDFQMSLGAEYSVLSQSDNFSTTKNTRKFFRPKGFVSASYKYSASLDIRAKLEREVGQLNFFDFVSSTNLQDDLDVTANPDLVPAQSWLANVQFDKDLGWDSRFTANVYGAIISDIIDRIPIGAMGEGVGNLDKAYRYGVDLSVTVKGERWGWSGTQLDLRLDLRKSSLNDPLEGFKRRINSDKKGFYLVEFRHDVENTNWAYGLSAERFFRAPEYRAFSFSQTNFDRPYAKIFIEHKDLFGLRVRGEVSNLTDRVTHFDRTFYAGRRDISPVERVESRERRVKPFIRFEVSGQF